MSSPSTPPATFEAAVALFNRRQFFECHEVLEDLWRPLPKGPEKWFLQGLLQVGVGFHHLEQENYTGAKNLLTAGIEKLKITASNKKGFVAPIELAPLLLSSHAALETLVVLGPDRMDEFPEALIPQIPSA
jgi:predicted metal-dependent hydrolase